MSSPHCTRSPKMSDVIIWLGTGLACSLWGYAFWKYFMPRGPDDGPGPGWDVPDFVPLDWESSRDYVRSTDG